MFAEAREAARSLAFGRDAKAEGSRDGRVSWRRTGEEDSCRVGSFLMAQRESSPAVQTHSPQLQEQAGNPPGCWTDAHPKKKKKPSISILPIKM